jgi:hypothetical protein
VVACIFIAITLLYVVRRRRQQRNSVMDKLNAVELPTIDGNKSKRQSRSAWLEGARTSTVADGYLVCSDVATV